ncbi:MAG: HEAT repeat domain-containing protein [Candidatus Firestonebacteria bacterium]|nr:HEAT repeat domain-containing protein [Candidatus Firestonebacteria bacterium]
MKKNIFLIIINFFFIFFTPILAQEEIAETTAITAIDTAVDTTINIPSFQLWKRLKVKVKNDSTLLIYAFKTDIKEILNEIDIQSKRYNFKYDSTVSGISPEISMQKENLDIAIDLILKKNNLYKEMFFDSASKIDFYRIKTVTPIIEKATTAYELSLEEKLKNSSNVDVYQNTIKEMKDNSKKSIPILIGFLKGEDKELRKTAAFVLGEINSNETLPALFVVFKEDPDYSVKNSVIEALYKMAKYKTEILPELLNVFNASSDDLTRLQAMLGYLKINNNNNEKNNFLHDILNDKSGIIRMKAADFIISQGDRSVVSMAKNDIKSSDPYVRKLAVEVLGKSQDMRNMPFIKDAMVDPDSDVRNKAKLASRRLEYSSVVFHAADDISKINYLREILVNESYREVKYWAAKEMINLGTTGVDALKEIAKKPENYGNEASFIASKALNSPK